MEAHPKSLLLHAQIQQTVPREWRPSLGAQEAREANGATGEEDFPPRLGVTSVSLKQVTALIPSPLLPEIQLAPLAQGKGPRGVGDALENGKS